MAENSAIQWTTHTFNPWRGCTRVSEGCRFCYADTLSKRNPKTRRHRCQQDGVGVRVRRRWS